MARNQTRLTVQSTIQTGALDNRMLNNPIFPGRRDGVRELTNAIVQIGTGVKKRPGTRQMKIRLDDGVGGDYDYVHTEYNRDVDENFAIAFGVHRDTKQVKILIHRVFDSGAAGQDQIIERADPFQPGRIRVRDIKFKRTINSIVITHPKLPPHELVYTGGNFTLRSRNFINPPMQKLNETLARAQELYPGRVVEISETSGQSVWIKKNSEGGVDYNTDGTIVESSIRTTLPVKGEDENNRPKTGDHTDDILDYIQAQRGSHVTWNPVEGPPEERKWVVANDPQVVNPNIEVIGTEQQPGIYRMLWGDSDGFPWHAEYFNGHLVMAGAPGAKGLLHVSFRNSQNDFTEIRAVPQDIPGDPSTPLDQVLLDRNAATAPDFGRTFNMPTDEEVTGMAELSGLLVRTATVYYRITDFNTSSLAAENTQTGPVRMMAYGGEALLDPLFTENAIVDFDPRRSRLYYQTFGGVEVGNQHFDLTAQRNSEVLDGVRITKLRSFYVDGSSNVIAALRDDGRLLFITLHLSNVEGSNVFGMSEILISNGKNPDGTARVAKVKDIVSVREDRLMLILERDGGGSVYEILDRSVYQDAVSDSGDTSTITIYPGRGSLTEDWLNTTNATSGYEINSKFIP